MSPSEMSRESHGVQFHSLPFRIALVLEGAVGFVLEMERIEHVRGKTTRMSRMIMFRFYMSYLTQSNERNGKIHKPTFVGFHSCKITRDEHS